MKLLIGKNQVKAIKDLFNVEVAEDAKHLDLSYEVKDNTYFLSSNNVDVVSVTMNITETPIVDPSTGEALKYFRIYTYSFTKDGVDYSFTSKGEKAYSASTLRNSLALKLITIANAKYKGTTVRAKGDPIERAKKLSEVKAEKETVKAIIKAEREKLKALRSTLAPKKNEVTESAPKAPKAKKEKKEVANEDF